MSKITKAEIAFNELWKEMPIKANSSLYTKDWYKPEARFYFMMGFNKSLNAFRGVIDDDALVKAHLNYTHKEVEVEE